MTYEASCIRCIKLERVPTLNVTVFEFPQDIRADRAGASVQIGASRCDHQYLELEREGVLAIVIPARECDVTPSNWDQLHER